MNINGQCVEKMGKAFESEQKNGCPNGLSTFPTNNFFTHLNTFLDLDFSQINKNNSNKFHLIQQNITLHKEYYFFPFFAMKTLILQFIFLLIILAISQGDIRIRPHGLGSDGSLYVLSSGSRLELECQVDKEDFGGTEDVNALDWIRGKLRIAHNWLSMYTSSKVDEQGRWIRQTLVLPKVDEQSAGEYKCVFFDDQQKSVRLHVLGLLNWRTKTDKPGGPVGQPLTIDCGANEVSDDAIKILDHKGRGIDGSTNGEVVVAGSELTIPKLGREHQGMKIRCVAIRRISLADLNIVGPDSMHTDERELTVDVWIPPKFDESEASGPHYAVPGSKQVLRWTIVESNPPVQQWTLRKDGRAIGGNGADGPPSERIQIVQKMDEPQPMFAVSIDEVEDDDYGRYTLHVHNGKLGAEQTMSLVVTQPPTQPRVMDEWISSNGSVSWRIMEQHNQGQLPVTYFWIIYKPIRRVQMPILEQNNTRGVQKSADFRPNSNQISQIPPLNATNSTQQPYRLRRRKNPTNLYDIAGLDRYTEYEFTFIARNQAGESDPLTMKIATIDRPPNEAPTSSSIKSSQMIGIFTIVMALVFLLTMWRE